MKKLYQLPLKFWLWCFLQGVPWRANPLQSPQVNQRLLLGPDIISNDISNDRLKSENSLGQRNNINYILHYNVILIIMHAIFLSLYPINCGTICFHFVIEVQIGLEHHAKLYTHKEQKQMKMRNTWSGVDMQKRQILYKKLSQ